MRRAVRTSVPSAWGLLGGMRYENHFTSLADPGLELTTPVWWSETEEYPPPARGSGRSLGWGMGIAVPTRRNEATDHGPYC